MLKFDAKNGILTVLKNVFVKLVKMDHKKIRSLAGLSPKMFELIKQSRIKFMPPIVNDLSVQNKEDLVVNNNFVRIIKCSNYTNWTWAFVDYVLENNTFIFHMNFRSVRPNIFDMGGGVIEVNDRLPFGDTKNAAMHCLYHCHGELTQNGSSDGNHVWRENDIVGIEVNTRDRTLRFTVNGRLQPVSYSSIPPRLRFCVAESCTSIDGYNLEDPNLKCARYMHTMAESRIAGSGDEIELVSFCRFVAPPPLQRAPADVYDPDHIGYKRRVVEWNYLRRKRR